MPIAARAQDSAQLAQQRFARGLERFEARDYAHAIDEFRASLTLFASPNSRLLLARSLRALGRADEALLEFERAAREAADRAPTDPRYEDTRQAAAAGAASVEPQIARLAVTIAGPPAGRVRARINGRPLPEGALGLALPVMPGEVRVTAEAEGFAPATRVRRLAAGERAALAFALEPSPRSAARSAPSAAGTAPGQLATDHGAGIRTTGWIAAATAVVGAGAFAGFGLAADAQFRGVSENFCDGTFACTREGWPSQVETGRTLQMLTNVALGVGVVTAVAAAVLLPVGYALRGRGGRVALGRAGLVEVRF